MLSLDIETFQADNIFHSRTSHHKPAAPAVSAPPRSGPYRGADGRPPVQWSAEDFGTVEKIDRAFYEYYQERGHVRVPSNLPPDRDRFQGHTSSLLTGIRAEPVLPPVSCVPRRDNERSEPPHMDNRKARGVLQDVSVGGPTNTNVETDSRFAHSIQNLQRAKILPGQNGEYKTGATWGREAETKAANPDSDRAVVETNHAFLPRHSRSRRIGPGYHGYDEVFRQQRDGVTFTSKDLAAASWKKERDTSDRSTWPPCS